MVEIAAIVASTILAGLVLFQAALITGAPLGKFAWGGQHTVLPRNLRIASTVSIILYFIFALFILAKAGLVLAHLSFGIVGVGMWILVGYFSLGIVMNAISRSKPERLIMTPVATMLAGLFLYVALSG